MTLPEVPDHPTLSPRQYNPAAVALLAWEALSVLKDVKVARVEILREPEGGKRKRGRITLRFAHDSGQPWQMGIQYGLPPISRGGQRRAFFEFGDFLRDPSNPESSGLVLACAEECEAAVRAILVGLQRRGEASEVVGLLD